MTKILSVFLAAAMLLCLCACEKDDQEIQPNNTTTQSTPATDHTEQSPVAGYSFAYKGVELMPGGGFSEEKLPQPQYSYTAPNCALDGNDTIYNYTDIEVAVYYDGKTSVVQSVYIINPNLVTPEGLALGDDLTKVTKLYGDTYTVNGAEWQFVKGNMILAILTQDDFVASIEYRLAG